MTTREQVEVKLGKVAIGVADLAISNDPEGFLITYALGSCIAVTLYDPFTKIGGMLHFMLPDPPTYSRREPEDVNPFMYASTGLPILFASVLDLGARRSRLIVCAAGGAEIMCEGKMFAIGKRNRTMMRKIFWKDNTILTAEDTGGNIARTMSLDLAEGVVKLKKKFDTEILWQA